MRNICIKFFNMEITIVSINNNLDALLKSDYLIVNDNIILDRNIWKNALATHIKFGNFYNQPLDKNIFLRLPKEVSVASGYH